jgi:transcriptional regulator with XRE-family HTH domain
VDWYSSRSATNAFHELREKQGVTRSILARLPGSSQSRAAQMEAGYPSVTVNLLLKALLIFSLTRQRLSDMIA